MQKFDVLIVGAGMVGLTLALALRKNSQLSIAIVDTAPLTEVNDALDVRVSAINIASKNIFDNIDVWSTIEKNRLQAYQHMHVWDKAGPGKLDFSVESLKQSSSSFAQQAQLGWIIENKVIRHALWQKAQQDEGIHFFTETKLANIAVGESEVFASFTDNTLPIIAKLVVGADGANSWVRQQMNMAMIFKDYDHHAIVATVSCSQGHQNTAWQVFLESGPLAFLPLQSLNSADNSSQASLSQGNLPEENLSEGMLCSIVYSTSPDEAKRLIQLNPADFAKELTAASDGKLGNIHLQSERFTYPLTMRLAQDFVKDRVVLIGDAAHTIHPLAGQGVNLGLLDAIALAETLATQVKESKDNALNDFVNEQRLKAFSRWRKTEASEMIVSMAAIKQTFTPQAKPIKLLRGLGMNLLNHFSPIKNQLISQALGLKEDLPALAYKKDKV